MIYVYIKTNKVGLLGYFNHNKDNVCSFTLEYLQWDDHSPSRRTKSDWTVYGREDLSENNKGVELVT